MVRRKNGHIDTSGLNDGKIYFWLERNTYRVISVVLYCPLTDRTQEGKCLHYVRKNIYKAI